MPANLTPEKITALESMMAIVPKEEGTEKLCTQLKARMTKLREQIAKTANGRWQIADGKDRKNICFRFRRRPSALSRPRVWQAVKILA